MVGVAGSYMDNCVVESGTGNLKTQQACVFGCPKFLGSRNEREGIVTYHMQ